MGRKLKGNIVQASHFRWRIYQRPNGKFYADGRTNSIDIGRHSLETTDSNVAIEVVKDLDLAMAVRHGLAVSSGSSKHAPLSLVEGRNIYLTHVGRPTVTGGALKATQQRYAAIFDKFLPFALEHCADDWRSVTKRLLVDYSAWLDQSGYSYSTQYIELTTIKQAVKHLVLEGYLPEGTLITLALSKPRGTSTFCYTAEMVDAIVEHCYMSDGMQWLGNVVIALAHTGLRIGELSDLRWTDVDLEKRRISLSDRTRTGTLHDRQTSRSTKSHRDRVLPVHDRLADVLEGLSINKKHRVFWGPRGGKLKPDTVRNILVRDVLTPLASRFPSTDGGASIINGRLHSFRHFFCSTCANNGVPEQMLMSWLGHSDSKMVRHYYHQNDRSSLAAMDNIQFTTPSSPAL